MVIVDNGFTLSCDAVSFDGKTTFKGLFEDVHDKVSCTKDATYRVLVDLDLSGTTPKYSCDQHYLCLIREYPKHIVTERSTTAPSPLQNLAQKKED